ncbi:MAG: hypothetical protein LUB61_01415 [Eggerthellaceae bacterium]|nr:hypothetical protein [Eggerthellaceae bacterium]
MKTDQFEPTGLSPKGSNIGLTARDAASKGARILLALMIIFMLAIPASMCVKPLRASAQDHENVHLSVMGDEVRYAGYSTGRMYVNGIPAYCAEPELETPADSDYVTSSVSPIGVHTIDQVCAALYYGFGGPGFYKEMWPETWYDGSPMTDDDYWALTHILVADMFTGNGEEALTGCDDDFVRWCFTYILGGDYYGGTYNGENYDSVQYKIYSHLDAGDVPQSFMDCCFEIETADGTQTILCFTACGYV